MTKESKNHKQERPYDSNITIIYILYNRWCNVLYMYVLYTSWIMPTYKIFTAVVYIITLQVMMAYVPANTPLRSLSGAFGSPSLIHTHIQYSLSVARCSLPHRIIIIIQFTEKDTNEWKKNIELHVWIWMLCWYNIIYRFLYMRVSARHSFYEGLHAAAVVPW